jgi:hypothetical protein
MASQRKLATTFEKAQKVLIKHQGSRKRAAKELGLHISSFQRVLSAGRKNGYRFVPPPPKDDMAQQCKPTYLPSQEEIAAQCMLFKSMWSEVEERNRRGFLADHDERYEIPMGLRCMPLDGRAKIRRR